MTSKSGSDAWWRSASPDLSLRAMTAEEAAARDEDRDLARRCAKGDERAMRCVFEAHEPRLRALARRILGNPQDAEEVAVATFLRFWRAAGRYRGECTLKAYLTRIALNLAKDRVRKVAPSLAPPPVRESPLADRIRDGMLRLEPDDREILALYYLEESTYEELMETLGVSYDVVRTRLVRARQRLRRAVEVDDERL